MIGAHVVHLFVRNREWGSGFRDCGQDDGDEDDAAEERSVINQR